MRAPRVIYGVEKRMAPVRKRMAPVRKAIEGKAPERKILGNVKERSPRRGSVPGTHVVA